MKKKIYHGSEKIITKPELNKGNINNDFGRGFYCTEHIELAKEWACKQNRDGFANAYMFDFSGLKICNLNSEDYNILNWLALLTKNRSYWQKKSIAEEAKKYLQDNYLIDISVFDVIIGYRADDSYFSYMNSFLENNLSVEALLGT